MPNPSENLRRRKDLSPFLFHFTKGDDAEAIIRTIVQESKLKSDVGYICFTERPLIMCDELLATKNEGFGIYKESAYKKMRP